MNTSLHDHSSVQLLKRNRNGFQKWNESLSTEDRNSMALWKKAPKGENIEEKEPRPGESEIVKTMEMKTSRKQKYGKIVTTIMSV